MIKTTRGFTLIEMAIVLIIITILIGGLAVPLSAQIQARRVAETRTDLRAVQDALIGYAMSNQIAGRPFLPCPDNGAGTPGDEARDADGHCVTSRGMLPWRALGVNDSDAWGQRYTYAVTPEFTTGFTSSPPATAGTLQVHVNATCAGAGVAAQAAVVIVSHGPNGRGARNKSGGTPLVPADVPTEERQNLPTPAAPCGAVGFISHASNVNFDDLVVWLSPNNLFSRVCPDGGCP